MNKLTFTYYEVLYSQWQTSLLTMSQQINGDAKKKVKQMKTGLTLLK